MFKMPNSGKYLFRTDEMVDVRSGLDCCRYALSLDALNPGALSRCALSPNGLRNTWKNPALQVNYFRESI